MLGLGYLLVCVAGRWQSPWPLEWMESASVAHAERLLRAQPLYAPPSAEHIPFVYPPLSYLPMGLGHMLSGGALWGGRLASLCAIVACVWALVRAGSHLRATSAAGWLAAGIFGAGYGYTGGFLDLARVDAWFLALCLWGVERCCARRPAQSLWVLALACLAKQHAWLLLVAASGGMTLCQDKGSFRALCSAWLGLGLVVTLLQLWTDGWIWTYCVRVPARHGLHPGLLLSFVFVDLLLYLPMLSGLALYVLLRRGSRVAQQRQLLMLLLAAAIVASALGRAHPGGDDNVRLPAYGVLALVAAVAFVDLLENARSARGRVLLIGGLALQLSMLLQDPRLYWPSRESIETFSQLRAALTRCAGGADFVAMDHPGLGARPFAHTLALSDLRMNHDELGEEATQAVLAALRGAEAPHAVAISASFPALLETLAARYELCARIPQLQLATGYRLGETYVYKRKPR
jgi:hypothetical protein